MATTFEDFKKDKALENQESNQENQEEKQVEVPESAEGEKAVEPVEKTEERPDKNYEAENRRKTEEIDRLKDENLRLREVPPVTTSTPPPTQTNWLDNVTQMAENEMATTGRTVPIDTIARMSDTIAKRSIEDVLKTKGQSEKEIRNFKRSVRKDPDFNGLEDGFDELVEQLQPNQVNAPTLEVILNSVRGKKYTPEYLNKQRSQGKEEAEKDTTILNQPTASTGTGVKPGSSLTSDQKEELEQMNQNSSNQYTEGEYLGMIKNKQIRFKVSGAKNVPQLWNDQMIK